MRQFRLQLEDKEQIKLKKLLYVLRPAMAVRWTRLHPNDFPPMDFRELMARCDVETEIQFEIEDILALKAKTKEIGLSPARPRLNAFCLEEFERAKAVAEAVQGPANNLFREILKSVW